MLFAFQGDFMAAPIQRYSDPRLYGTSLVSPFAGSYEWIRTVAHPWHPRCSFVAECAFRAMKTFTGIVALGISALPALAGRIVQIIHYHWIPAEVRAHPAEIVIKGMHLPQREVCSKPVGVVFHGTDQESAIGILRWGFDPRKTALGAKMGEAAYVSARPYVSAAYGVDQLILLLDLREGEIAYVTDEALGELGGGQEDMAAVRQLFFQNGYRAIRYDLPYYGIEEAWAIYDPSCISITKIQPSPFPVPPLQNAHPIVSRVMGMFQRKPQLLVH